MCGLGLGLQEQKVGQGPARPARDHPDAGCPPPLTGREGASDRGCWGLNAQFTAC